MKQQVKELLSQGVPIRKIAKALRISRSTVRQLARSEEAVADAADVPAMRELPPWLSALPVETMLEKRRKGRTFMALYDEHKPNISYSTFRRALSGLAGQTPAAAAPRLIHKPGERVHVDYCDGVKIFDRLTGEMTKTQFFCGVLPFSGLTFGEFCLSQKLDSFIASHERMWSYFGGVTPYVVIDNLKSGVQNAHRYDPEVNPTYCDYANTRKFVVLPARPYTPRDKASVEAAIGVIQRTFFQTVAERTFYSLAELNQSFREFLDRLNTTVMKDYGVSRRDRFEEESRLLQPITAEPYEISQWKEVKVHPDCHVQILHNFYSVPFTFIGQKVCARVRRSLIEIFTSEGDSIAAHVRLEGRGRYSTNDLHYPEIKRQLNSFDIRSAIGKAEACGPKLAQLVRLMFEGERPLRRLRLVQGMLRLVQNKIFTGESIEYAAAQCMTFHRYRLAFFTDCARNYSVAQQRSACTAPHREAPHLYVHTQGE